MKKNLIFIIILVLTIIGCSEKKENSELNYDYRNTDEILALVSEENINLLITNEYSDRELKDIMVNELDLESLDKEYRVECIRDDSFGSNFQYNVVYKGKSKFLFVYFDENGKRLYSYFVKISKEKSEFDFVEIGKTKKISIYLLDFGKGGFGPLHSTLKSSYYSVHYTKDGYVITYTYDEDGVVIDEKVKMI